ncbi:MAG: methyl-accepting chemotaxis protein [Rickettsiales bacterium]
MSIGSMFNNMPISRKFAYVMIMLLLPSVALNYFIIVEKQSSIDFAKKEIAGARYLSAAHEAVRAITAPVTNPLALAKAAAALKDAELHDAGTLAITEKTKNIVAGMEAKSPNVHVLADQAADLITTIADNSNITLDPDIDSYYVGDALINQTTNLYLYGQDLADSTQKLLLNAADDNEFAVDEYKIAFADGNFETDNAKSMAGNSNGIVKAQLETLAVRVNTATTKLEASIKTREPNSVTAATEEMNVALDAYRTQGTATFEQLINGRIAKMQGEMIRSLSIAGVLAVIGIILALIIIRSITKPVGMMAGLMGRLTAGDLAIEVPQLDRHDEIGVLSESLVALHQAAVEREQARVMENTRLAKDAKRAETIQNTTRQFESRVQGIVSTVAAAATELSHTAQQMTKIMQQASSNTSQAVTNAAETSGNVQSVAAAAEELAASVREISSQVQKTNTLVRDSQTKTNAADQKAVALTDASSKVREAVTLIATISSKINLLALNATIESARAGEAGRGFAVVASEVKVLANQTNQSLEDIGRVIEGMDMASDEITRSLSDIKHSVEEVSIASNSIAAAVEEQSATTNEITRNMQSAAQGTSLISSNLNTVSENSQDATASAGEVLSAAQELSRQAEELNREVNDFLEIIKSA